MTAIELERINLKDVGLCRYKKLGGRYLLTNDIGDSLFLGEKEFTDFIESRLDKNSLVHKALNERNFVYSTIDKDAVALKYREKYGHIRRGTSLHIVIPTLRCNHRCIYCHAEARPYTEKGYDMDKETARKVVDTIFESPSPHITIEFQGGEPLLNWDVVVYIIQYASKINRKLKRSLSFVLVSNLTLMTKEMLRLLLRKGVSVCTSLDGPKFIHDRNRPMIDGRSGYELTTRWIKEVSNIRPGFSSALSTLTNYSLNYPEEIINEYLKFGMFHIPLRPISVLGFAGARRGEIGITAEQFLNFYRYSLDYIIELSFVTEQNITERMAKICLRKIFGLQGSDYMDMRSPCGAGCGQLAYFYDGSVYTCDEARMLGEDSFKLGNVKLNSYQELMQSSQMKASVFASCLDGLYCDYCVYKPYCGVCPVVNWKECGSIYAKPKSAFMCKIYQGIFDCVFQALQDKSKARILKSWIGMAA